MRTPIACQAERQTAIITMSASGTPARPEDQRR